MKVWLVTVGEPLPVLDENPRLFRTGLLATFLTARDHEVTWWTSSFDHYGKRHRVSEDASIRWDGGEIRLLHSVGYPRNLSIRRFVEHAGVARKFAAYARSTPAPDVVMADLPTIELAHAAMQFGKDAGIPVVIDVRDLWPDAFFDLLPKGLGWAGRVALRGMTRDARAALAGSKGLVAVSAGYLRWGLAMAGRPAGPFDAVFPMGYVPQPNAKNLDLSAARLRKLGVDEQRKICWYAGSFGRTYDLAPLIETARTLDRMGRSDIQFVICGEGELGGRWRGMARGARNVVFTGWVGADEISWLSRIAAVGLQPYAPGAPQGLPNKLFEYMSAGIPVVSSLRGECEALLNRIGCGITYDAGDAGDLTEILLRLFQDEKLREEMGRRSRAAFEHEFDGRLVLPALADHLEIVARDGWKARTTST